MKPMSKLDPKLMQLGEDVPSVWGVDGGRGDLTVSKESIKSGSFRKREGVKSARRPGGPEARRPGARPLPRHRQLPAPAWAALALPFGLFAAAPVTAQVVSPNLWSATLTVHNDAGFFGCDTADSSQVDCDTPALTENEFTYGGITYAIHKIYWGSSQNRLWIDFHEAADLGLITAFNSSGQNQKNRLSSLTLNVDGTPLAISTASIGEGGFSDRIYWSYQPSPAWTDGQTVSLSLLKPSAYSGTVTLEADKTTFTEENAGSTTLRVRLDPPPQRSVFVRISEDNGTLPSGTITAAAGRDYQVGSSLVRNSLPKTVVVNSAQTVVGPVRIRDDSLVEGTETFRLTAAVDGLPWINGSLDFTIEDAADVSKVRVRDPLRLAAQAYSGGPFRCLVRIELDAEEAQYRHERNLVFPVEVNGVERNVTIGTGGITAFAWDLDKDDTVEVLRNRFSGIAVSSDYAPARPTPAHLLPPSPTDIKLTQNSQPTETARGAALRLGCLGAPPPQAPSAPTGSGATAGTPSGPQPSGSQPSGSIPRPNNNNNNNGQNPVDKNGVPLPVPQSDLRPTFGDITVEDQSYTQGMRIEPLTLPAGTGGNDPLTYALTPALPAGLMLDMATRRLSGTPSMPQEARQYTWTATDADGDVMTLEFSIAVAAAPEPKKVAAREWPIRFGRTVSQQVTDALQSRFTASPQPGLHLTVAGEELNGAVPLAENRSALAKLLGFETLTSHQLVQDSSFSFSPSVSAPHLSFWGEGALSSFSGKAATVTLEGDVTTALLGAEWNAERWQAGAALSHSWGNGGYEAENGMEGEISTTMTGLYPYGRYALSPRLGIWASAGYGWGTLSLTSEGTKYNPSANMTMAAAGMDGLLLDGGAEGLSLSTIADVMTVKTTTDAVDGLAGSEGNVSRFRLGLEAVRPFPLSNGASLLPSLSVGVRQDSGDAETGFGTELGAGVSWMDPQRGISADIKGRILLTHGSEDFQERGMALSFAWDPNPSDRGPSFSVSHALGAAATGGLDALLNPTTMEGLDADPDSNEHQQFATRLAYGFPAFGDRLTITPSLGLALSPYSSSTSLLWALTPYAGTGQVDEPWTISLEGQRQEDTTPASLVDYSFKLRFSLLF